MGLTLTFIGMKPRYLKGYDRDAYRPFTDKLAQTVGLWMAAGVDTFTSIGEQGIEQLAFWAVEKARRAEGAPPVRNIVVPPYPNVDGGWATDGPFGRAEFARLCQKADSCTPFSDVPWAPGPRDHGKPTTRQEAYLANIAASDIVCSFWLTDVWAMPDRGNIVQWHVCRALSLGKSAGMLPVSVKGPAMEPLWTDEQAAAMVPR